MIFLMSKTSIRQRRPEGRGWHGFDVVLFCRSNHLDRTTSGVKIEDWLCNSYIPAHARTKIRAPMSSGERERERERSIKSCLLVTPTKRSDTPFGTSQRKRFGSNHLHCTGIEYKRPSPGEYGEGNSSRQNRESRPHQDLLQLLESTSWKTSARRNIDR
jgi:hypothetical protein